ncbi:hypothetical protein [Desulfobacula toluolica]|uniref:Uncharacterized protein n=1 Tax=Desulfobacula toluolica (strain DSM 7467 / Tol2) TaxID=651182 RepID=K0NGF2_DESTT|nr:hypothetical protein [Desulfobacula toluolica]CCK78903.1 uncharacterized protein TOL2_C07350 [Desulfobacula toluolica Tol2]
MHLPSPKGWLAVLFIVLTLAIPFAITYYVSTPSYQDRYRGRPKSLQTPGLPSRSKIMADQLLLLKNEKFITNRTAIVFKGLSGNTATIDLYLLDLDPEVSYTLKFPKTKTDEDIRIGNVMYRLISVKDKMLRLKIKEIHHTR